MQPDIQIWNDFLMQSQNLFTYLEHEVDWDKSMHARKTASFGVPYNYSQMTYPAQPFPTPLASLLPELKEYIGFTPNNCLINYYPNGAATMGFHFDSLEHLAPDTGVAIVSLGDTRSLTFRNRTDKTVEVSYPLVSGSLLYMPPQVQNEWLHGVMKSEPEIGPRMSLTFRHII